MQEINFYQSLSRPGRFGINASHVKIVLSSWILLLLCIFIAQGIYALFQNERYHGFVGREKKLTAEIEGLIQHSPKIKQVNNLEKTIASYSEQIKQKTNFIQEIARYNAQSMQFEPALYLNELSNATTPNVWLTKIVIQNQGQKISLAGFTLSASQLTEFIMRLQKEAHFEHKPFAKVSIINVDNADKMPFILSTQEQKEEKEQKEPKT